MSAITADARPVNRRPRIVARSRLDRRLDALVDEMPLTVVTGPAGSGKTVLLDTFARRAGAAMLTVTRRRTDTARFRCEVDEALAAADVGTLVLDDLHAGGDAMANTVIRFVHDRPDLRLVVASRSEPAIGLARRRVEGTVGELRAADLAFDEAEAEAMVEAAGVRLEADQLARLVRRTEGWAAGLRLALLALDGRSDVERFLAEFSGTDWAIADYLVGELLEQQGREAREFLIRTSIVDEMCGDLADALTGRSDGALLLLELERSGCLLHRLDRHGRWFRYHPLLLELLRSRLRAEGPALRSDLHARAAQWLAGNRQHRQAIEHIAAGADPTRVGILVQDHWPKLLLDPPPASALRAPGATADPRLCLAAAVAALEAGETGAGVQALDAVGSEPPLVHAAAELVRARLDHDVDRAQRASTVLAAAAHPTSSAPAGAEELRLLARHELGRTAFAAGAREDALGELEAAAVLAEDLGWKRVHADCLARIATLNVVVGRLGRAEHAARDALGMDTRKHSFAVLWAHVALSAVYLLRGEVESAEGFSDIAAAEAARAADVLAGDAVRAVRGQLLVVAGSAGEAAVLQRALAGEAPGRPLLAQWLDALGPRVGARADEPVRTTALDVATERLTAGEALSAVARVAPYLDRLCAAPVTLRIHAHLIAARARRATGQPKQSAAALTQALRLAAAERIWLPFVQGGAPLRRQLEHYAGTSNPYAPLAGELLGRLAGTASMATQDELSERERQVLRLLPTLMSSAEMGSELFVSVNTVKTHTRSIYRKLGVSSRRAAVIRAQQVGLL